MLLENKVDCVRGLVQRAINHQSFNKTKLKHLKKVHRYFTTNRERMQDGDCLDAARSVEGPSGRSVTIGSKLVDRY